MVNATVKKTFNDIKSLRIQGARNVAIEALKSLRSVKVDDLEESCSLLEKSRPTEPMMRNGLSYVKHKSSTGIEISKAVDDYLAILDKALSSISEMGARRIADGFTVMTHCHSSTVTSIIKKAHDQGKHVRVISSETRPLFQGRKTAKELSDYGIPVTSIVDSGMRSYVGKADLCLVGCDAITADGHVVNKIGTSMLALAAREANKPFIVASEIFKFDPKTLKGSPEVLEKRDSDEVWKIKKKGITVENIAFDVTPPELISCIITEQGVLNPYNVCFFVSDNYRWMF